jgi:PIN domain nuclease of toxin-antitoxin system
MRILIDTHVFLWLITGDLKMPTTFRNALLDPSNEVFLSAASIWEAVIKHALGKLPLPDAPAEYLPRQREAHQIASLPIDESVFTHLGMLPPIHRDPFDRILIAQSLRFGLTLASVDHFVRSYGTPLLPLA